jgi:DNA-binding CsgD family transcriptional regulator
MMVGRPRESAAAGEKRGLEALRPFGIDSTVLVANTIEAQLAIGAWDEADSASAAAIRSVTANFPYMLLMLRADLELGRGDFEAARAHLDAALGTLREDRGQGSSTSSSRSWRCGSGAGSKRTRLSPRPGRGELAPGRTAPRLVLRQGLRAHAELAALARARRDAEALRTWLGAARRPRRRCPRAAAEASAVTPNAALARPGRGRARARARHRTPRVVVVPQQAGSGSSAHRRRRTARWRQAEALVSVGATRAEASMPLRGTCSRDPDGSRHSFASSSCSPNVLGSISRHRASGPSARNAGLEELLGLTPREAEVLTLVARGYTNREIADKLVISVKTASVHVSHILGKLAVPNRVEAAAIAHRLAVPGRAPAERGL